MRVIKKAQQGFTLIELVIVIIILGLLAATALPRFISVTKDAEQVSVQGVAGGFASAVGLVRAQWEVDGRPNGNGGANITSVSYDNVSIGVDGTRGYPSGNPATNTLVSTVLDTDCLYLFNNLFQGQSVTAATTFATTNAFYVRVDTNICNYHQTNGLTAAPTDNTNSNGFTYNASTGAVAVFLKP